MTLPILYSFRRCPYAMRARLAIAEAGKQVELREIVLRDKAPEFLEASPKGTVPVLVLPNGQVIEESLEVMGWALENLREDQMSLIMQSDKDFKPWLDRYKYPTRYEGVSAEEARAKASEFLHMLNDRLEHQDHLFGDTRTPADFGIAPFVRQFAHVDLEWFKSQPWLALISWYESFVEWEGFQAIMRKYPKWVAGDALTHFPETDQS